MLFVLYRYDVTPCAPDASGYPLSYPMGRDLFHPPDQRFDPLVVCLDRDVNVLSSDADRVKDRWFLIKAIETSLSDNRSQGLRYHDSGFDQ